MKKYLQVAALLLIGFLLNMDLLAQQPAFPGAEGCGMYTTGGRGTTTQPTTVFEVTSLADDNVAGTLRYAINASQTTYPYRTIVFRVSGTIHLLSKLSIRSNTTIAGQTAPGDGICLADYPVVIGGDNVIIRYVRCRMGDRNQLKTTPVGCGVPVAPFTAACAPLDGSGGDDALGNLAGKNLIIDHCSVSWSTDEALTVYRGDSVTLQWNFIEEALNYSYHFETGDTDFEHHGFGGIWGSKHGSFHHNLIANCKSRCVRFGGNSTYGAGEIEKNDYRNNVMYNWELYTVYGGDGGNYNLVNNYYKYGPVTGSATKYRIVSVDSSAAYGYAKYYLNGNYVDGSPANTANNWSGATLPSGNAADSVKSKQTTPYLSTYPQITMQTATDAYESVLNNAGATLPRRDTLDRRIVNQVRTRTGKLIDVQGDYPHGTPYAQTVNAWPTLNSTAAPTDTDHDGMPDSWETANGLNPNNAADRQTIASNGYTNLENYLNGITNVSPELTFTGVLNTFSQSNAAIPSSIQTLSVSGINLTGNVTLTAPAGYEISTNGTTWVNSGSSITITPTSGSIDGVTLYIRLNASPINTTYAGNILAVTPNQTNFYIYVNNGGGTAITPDGPASATWTLLSTPNPSVSNSNITATSQVLGSAISGTAYGNTLGGVSGWQRAASTVNLPVGYNANSYVEYTVSPVIGKVYTLTSLSMGALGGGTGGARMAIFYSLDGFTTPGTSIGSINYNTITYSNNTDNINSVALLNSSTNPLTGQQIATANTNITVSSGQTLTLRVYVWASSTGRYFGSQNLVLNGNTTSIILPLENLEFSASLKQKQAQLLWTSTNEINVSHYELQSAGTDMRFSTVGNVTAKNGTGKNSYEFADPQPLTSIRYYRLKTLDKDGSYAYSKTVVLNLRTEGTVSIFPNPAVNNITITYPVTSTTKKGLLYSVDGRLLQTIAFASGTTQTTVDIKNLNAGNYYIKLADSNAAAPFVKR